MKAIGFGLERVPWTALKWPRLTLVVSLILVALGLFGLTRISFDEDLRNTLASNDEGFQQYEQATANFTDPENEILILVEGDHLGDPATFQKLQDFQFELQLADGVDSVFSLFALRQRPDAEGNTPLLVDDPAAGLTPDLIKRIRAYPILGSKLVSADGSAILFTVTPTVEKAPMPVARALKDEIERTATAVFGADGPRVTVTGFAAVRLSIVDILRRDQIVLNLAGALVGFAMSFLVFRSLIAALIVAIPSITAALMVVGYMSLFGLPVTVLTTVVPALVMIFGYTDGMHLCFSWRRHRDAGASVAEAESKAQYEVAGACLLAAITTSIAFCSLVISPVNLVRGFGWIGAVGTTLGAIAVLVLHGVVTNAIGHLWRTDGRTSRNMLTWLEGPCAAVGRTAVQVAKPITGLALVLFVVLGWMHLSVPPQHSIRENLPQSAPANAALTRLDTELGGSLPIQIVVPLHGAAPDSPEGLARIAAVHKAVEDIKGIDAPLSLWSVAEWLGGKADAATADKIKTFEGTLSDAAEKRFFDGKGAALVSAYLPNMPTYEIAGMITKIETAVHAAGGSDVVVTGVTVVNSREGGRTIATLNLSLMLSVVANLGVIALAFRSVPIGLLSFLPNILPLLATGSYLFLSKQGMQFTSVVALTVAFGIAVDGSVHFLNRFRLPENAALPFDQRLVETCRQVGPVLFGTTLIIIAGLSTTLTSGMPSVSLFGWIAALTLAVALIGDLVILPGLMAVFARRWFEPAPVTPRTEEKTA